MEPQARHLHALQIVRSASDVLNSLNHAVVAWDITGELLYVSDQASATFQWDPDALLGHSVAEKLVSAEDRPFATEVVRNVERDNPWAGDLMVRRGDGVVVRTAVNLSPLKTSDGTIVGAIATAEDVSAQRAAERRSTKMVNYLLQALAGGEVGTFNWDFNSGTVSWDEVTASLYAVAPELDIVTFDEWLDLVDDHDKDLVYEARTEAGQGDQYYRATYQLGLEDGTVRWINERGAAAVNPDGTISGIIGVVADATARVEHEREVAARAREAERLAAEEAQERSRLEFLTALDTLTLHASDHRDLMHQLAAECVPFLSDWCSIHFCAGGAHVQRYPEVVVAHRDPDRVDLLHQLVVKHPPGSALPVGAGSVIETGEAQHVENFDELRARAAAHDGDEMAADAARFFSEFDPVSLVALPLRTRGGLVGAIQFVTDVSRRPIGAADIALLANTASRVAEALESTWLRDEQRTLASTLQSALLPPKLRRIDGIDLAVRYWVAGAMSEVGGDFYDLYPLADDDEGRHRWVVVIGDVCGTGPAAAAVTAIARHTVRAAARHAIPHHEVLEWLNEAILHSDRDRFCTIVYSTLADNGDGTWTLTSVSGGHPLPVLVRSDGSTTAVGEPGTLMGVLDTIRSHTETTILHPGDTVVLYTDGFTDVPDGHGIDDDALYRLIKTAWSDSARADGLADSFGTAVESILPMAERDDDMALLVIRVEGPDDATGEQTVLLGERAFSPELRSVAQSRRFVDDLIGDIAQSELVMLGVSELASNAVLHARSEFVVRVMASQSVIRVEVIDCNPEVPELSSVAKRGIGGRGIRILDHLATRWGVEPLDGKKSVWFELHGPQPRRTRRGGAATRHG